MVFCAWQAYRRRVLALALIVLGFAWQWLPWARIDRAIVPVPLLHERPVHHPRPRLLPGGAVARGLETDVAAREGRGRRGDRGAGAAVGRQGPAVPLRAGRGGQPGLAGVRRNPGRPRGDGAASRRSCWCSGSRSCSWSTSCCGSAARGGRRRATADGGARRRAAVARVGASSLRRPRADGARRGDRRSALVDRARRPGRSCSRSAASSRPTSRSCSRSRCCLIAAVRPHGARRPAVRGGRRVRGRGGVPGPLPEHLGAAAAVDDRERLPGPAADLPLPVPVPREHRSRPRPGFKLFSLEPAILLVALSVTCLVVGYAAWVWRIGPPAGPGDGAVAAPAGEA